jgi:hypothetical protein
MQVVRKTAARGLHRFSHSQRVELGSAGRGSKNYILRRQPPRCGHGFTPHLYRHQALVCPDDGQIQLFIESKPDGKHLLGKKHPPGPSFQSDHQWRAEPDGQNVDHHLAVTVGKSNGKCGRLMGIVTEATNGNERTNGVDGLVRVRCSPDKSLFLAQIGIEKQAVRAGNLPKGMEGTGMPPNRGTMLNAVYRISDL